MEASDLFVKALEAEGVKYVFGIPGEETLDLLDSLKNSPIELVLTRHEQAAGFMAATVGRLTGQAGVCLSTFRIPVGCNCAASTAPFHSARVLVAQDNHYQVEFETHGRNWVVCPWS
jgi:acetolactate synthase-1/2/3 large subunit